MENYIFNIDKIINNLFFSIELWKYLTHYDICKLIKCSKDMILFCRKMNKHIQKDICFYINSKLYSIQKRDLIVMLKNFPNICNLTFFCYQDHYLHHNLVYDYIYNNEKINLLLKHLTIPINLDIDLNGISRLKNLQYLNLRFSSVNFNCSYLYKITNLKNLKYLDIGNNLNISNEIILCEVLSYVKSIETIKLNSTNVSGELFFYLRNCKHIKNIYFSSCRQLNKEFYNNLNYSSHITIINLSHTKINDKDFKILTTSLNLLIELYIDEVRTIIHPETLYEVVNLKYLKKLSLENMICNNKFINLISDKLKSLELLNLNNNRYIHGDDISNLLKLNNLKYLSVNNITMLYDSDLEPFKNKKINVSPLNVGYILFAPTNFENYRNNY